MTGVHVVGGLQLTCSGQYAFTRKIEAECRCARSGKADGANRSEPTADEARIGRFFHARVDARYTPPPLRSGTVHWHRILWCMEQNHNAMSKQNDGRKDQDMKKNDDTRSQADNKSEQRGDKKDQKSSGTSKQSDRK